MNITGMINSGEPHSVSSSGPSTDNSILDKPPPHLQPDWQFGLTTASEIPNAAEDQALDASLRWAGLQAALEAFKARHPTLPFCETLTWTHGNCRYVNMINSSLRAADSLIIYHNALYQLIIWLSQFRNVTNLIINCFAFGSWFKYAAYFKNFTSVSLFMQ